MPVVILQSAKNDLRDGYLFYEMQGGSHLGDCFLATLQDELSSLAGFAGIHSRRFGLHRALSRRFPYSIYYDIEDGEARVYGVLDNRRNPSWIYNHLQGARDFQSPETPTPQ